MDKPSERIVKIERSLMPEAIIRPKDALAIFRCAVMQYLDEQYDQSKKGEL